MKKVLLIFCLTVLFSGCRLPAERHVYKVAQSAAHSDPDWPEALAFPAIDACQLFVAKNMARVDVPIMLETNGMTVAAVYTVWAKRIARRWEYDRSFVRVREDSED